MAFSFTHRAIQPVKENQYSDVFEPRDLGIQIFASFEVRLDDGTEFGEVEWRFLGLPDVPLTLPELANRLEIPCEEDFQYWYNDLNWRALSEEYADDGPWSGWMVEEGGSDHSDSSASDCERCYSVTESLARL